MEFKENNISSYEIIRMCQKAMWNILA